MTPVHSFAFLSHSYCISVDLELCMHGLSITCPPLVSQRFLTPGIPSYNSSVLTDDVYSLIAGLMFTLFFFLLQGGPPPSSALLQTF